jgi:hypothetical protein
MSWLPFVPLISPIITSLCLLTRPLDIPNPWCKEVLSANTAQIVKALVAPATPVMANVGLDQPHRLQPEQESALIKALSIIASQPTPGLAALSEAELDSYLAGLEPPVPTTMLTVATSEPTTQPPA